MSDREEIFADHGPAESTPSDVALNQRGPSPTSSRREQMPNPRIPITPGLLRHHGKPAEIQAEQEDLSSLAANIQRILDEEARRHGIDV